MISYSMLRKAGNQILEMHEPLLSRPAPGIKKTKGEIRRKSVIKPRVNTASSGTTKSTASIQRFQSHKSYLCGGFPRTRDPSELSAVLAAVRPTLIRYLDSSFWSESVRLSFAKKFVAPHQLLLKVVSRFLADVSCHCSAASGPTILDVQSGLTFPPNQPQRTLSLNCRV